MGTYILYAFTMHFMKRIKYPIEIIYSPSAACLFLAKR